MTFSQQLTNAHLGQARPEMRHYTKYVEANSGSGADALISFEVLAQQVRDGLIPFPDPKSHPSAHAISAMDIPSSAKKDLHLKRKAEWLRYASLIAPIPNRDMAWAQGVSLGCFAVLGDGAPVDFDPAGIVHDEVEAWYFNGVSSHVLEAAGLNSDVITVQAKCADGSYVKVGYFVPPADSSDPAVFLARLRASYATYSNDYTGTGWSEELTGLNDYSDQPDDQDVLNLAIQMSGGESTKKNASYSANPDMTTNLTNTEGA